MGVWWALWEKNEKELEAFKPEEDDDEEDDTVIITKTSSGSEPSEKKKKSKKKESNYYLINLNVFPFVFNLSSILLCIGKSKKSGDKNS